MPEPPIATPSPRGWPKVTFQTDSDSATGWKLEGVGFPAVSSDGRRVALAFDAQPAGPPALMLTVELLDVDTSAVVRTSRFHEPYK